MKIPTKPWRVSAYKNLGRERLRHESKDFCFDEITVGGWLHIEQMDKDHYWMAVGDASFDIRLGKDGKYAVISQKTGKIAD